MLLLLLSRYAPPAFIWAWVHVYSVPLLSYLKLHWVVCYTVHVTKVCGAWYLHSLLAWLCITKLFVALFFISKLSCCRFIFREVRELTEVTELRGVRRVSALCSTPGSSITLVPLINQSLSPLLDPLSAPLWDSLVRTSDQLCLLCPLLLLTSSEHFCPIAQA